MHPSRGPYICVCGTQTSDARHFNGHINQCQAHRQARLAQSEASRAAPAGSNGGSGAAAAPAAAGRAESPESAARERAKRRREQTRAPVPDVGIAAGLGAADDGDAGSTRSDDSGSPRSRRRTTGPSFGTPLTPGALGAAAPLSPADDAAEALAGDVASGGGSPGYDDDYARGSSDAGSQGAASSCRGAAEDESDGGAAIDEGAGGDGSPGSPSSGGSGAGGPAAGARLLNAYEQRIMSAADHARREHARAVENNRKRGVTSLADLDVGAFVIEQSMSYGTATGVIRQLLNNPRVVPGGTALTVKTGETLISRARAFFERFGADLSDFREETITIDDPGNLVPPERRRVRLWVRRNPLFAIAAHIERYAYVGRNFLVHPSDEEPPYDHHMDPRFIASNTGPAVVGAPFKGALSTATVAAVEEEFSARHGELAPGTTLLVGPCMASLDFAAISKRKSAAAGLLQLLNWVGPFARSTEALIPMLFVEALDLGDVGSEEGARKLKRGFSQEVWFRALGQPIVDNHAAGGQPVGPLAGSGDTVYRLAIADCLRVQDHLAQAAECNIYANRCMLCSMPRLHFAHPTLGNAAHAALQMRDPEEIRQLRDAVNSAATPADARRAATARLHVLGVHPEPHWREQLVYTDANGIVMPLWHGSTDAPHGSYREPLHQQLLGLAEFTHRLTLVLIKRDAKRRHAPLPPASRRRILQLLDLRGDHAAPAFDDGMTEPITAVSRLSRSAKLTGDRRHDALIALSAALSTDATIIEDRDELLRVQSAINALLATLAMERALRFSQAQLDAYLVSQRTCIDAFIAAFKDYAPSRCNTTKVHGGRCHRALECRDAGAPTLRTAQHFERANTALVASYRASNKQSLAGLAARTTDVTASRVIRDALGVLDTDGLVRPLGRATSIGAYAPLPTARRCEIASTAVPRNLGLDVDVVRATLQAYADERWGDAGFDATHADIRFAQHATVVIPGHVNRSLDALNTRKPTYAILGTTAAGVEQLSLRTLRVARLRAFCIVTIAGSPRVLALASDLVTCCEGEHEPKDDDRQARLCREHIFAMVPLRDAASADLMAGRASALRVLDFSEPGDVLRLGYVLPRARFRPGMRMSAARPCGDYFLCVAKLLSGATKQPTDRGPATWLPTA